MKITSSVFENDQNIPPKYTCDGENINPPLFFNDIPANTKSLVLIVDDPDAPGGTWAHWLLWNIDALSTSIDENSVPIGSIQGINDFMNNNYGGPCPPSGVHHYHFKLYALSSTLNISQSTNQKDLENAIQDKILDSTELVGTYFKR